MNYHDKARQAIHDLRPEIAFSALYVVWFCKTLQNWKALVSTDVFSGLYWEVTYNGDKSETYVAQYVKDWNQVVTD